MKIVNKIYLDLFPPTTKRTKIAVDQVGRTARLMTYFLSSRARRFKKTYHHYLVNFYFHKLMYRYRKYLQW